MKAVTPKERESEFRRAMTELLTRHCAQMEITDGVCRIVMPSIYINGELEKDYCEFAIKMRK